MATKLFPIIHSTNVQIQMHTTRIHSVGAIFKVVYNTLYSSLHKTCVVDICSIYTIIKRAGYTQLSEPLPSLSATKAHVTLPPDSKVSSMARRKCDQEETT